MAEKSQKTGNGVAGLSAEMEEAVCNFILKKTGIVIHDHQLPNLATSIERGASHFGFKTVGGYVQALEGCGSVSPELEFLVSAITVGESYFFRDSEQIEFLRDKWLPEIIARKRASGDKSIRIWSAGCSGGQEIYTLAILLSEAMVDIKDWRIHLLGTDINTEALSEGIKANYRKWSFRSTPDKIREKYFTPSGERFVINPDLRRLVKFSYLNLRDDSYPSMLSETTSIDLILCRNVFIYFNREVIEEVLEKFSLTLNAEGVLLLGASDVINLTVSGLVMRHFKKTFFYEHGIKEEAPEPAAKVPVKVEQKRYPHAPKDGLEPRSRSGLGPVAKRSGPAVAPPVKKQATPPGDDPATTYPELIELDRSASWAELPDAVDRIIRRDGETEFLLCMKAKALANRGELKSALKVCNRAIETDPVGKHSYFIKAMTLMELDRSADAMEMLRKVIYLDPYFLEAHFQMGLLHIRSGNIKAGLKSLNNALDLAKKGDPERKLHTAPEMNYGRLVDVLKNEISIFEAQNNKRSV